MSKRILFVVLSLGLIQVGQPRGLAADVSYSGSVFFQGTPVVGGFVVAGTFKPGFDPLDYACVYGDIACNLEEGAYAHAVADGNFLPIGPGDLTDAIGAFSASGTTTAAAGTPLWLFAFQDNSKDSFFQALVSSSDPSWLVPAQPSGVTQIVASAANIFVMGDSHPQGVSLTVIPFPEPSTACLAVVCALAMSLSARTRFGSTC